MDIKCVFCGPVKNCAPYLSTVLNNIEKIGTLFDNFVIVLFYDHSTDSSLQILKNYQKNNPKLIIHINNNIYLSQYRTHRIAEARNYCLNEIRTKYPEYSYFIMMDFDDPNSKNCNIDVIKRALKREDWDALSFNTSPAYYDIWGLSIYPYCFSYNHFENNQLFYTIIQNYITFRLQNLNNNSLLPCISAFNGFAIYRTNKFLNCLYDGKINLNLVPSNYMAAHMKASNSKIVFNDYGHVKGKYEDCEHRALHVQAINKNNARIRISPEVVFN
jgi:hypothetical protein